MKSLLCCLLIVATACAGTTSFSMSSLGGSSSGSDGQVTSPNVFKLKKDTAIAALRRRFRCSRVENR